MLMMGLFFYLEQQREGFGDISKVDHDDTGHEEDN